MIHCPRYHARQWEMLREHPNYSQRNQSVVQSSKQREMSFFFIMSTQKEMMIVVVMIMKSHYWGHSCCVLRWFGAFIRDNPRKHSRGFGRRSERDYCNNRMRLHSFFDPIAFYLEIFIHNHSGVANDFFFSAHEQGSAKHC